MGLLRYSRVHALSLLRDRTSVRSAHQDILNQDLGR